MDILDFVKLLNVQLIIYIVNTKIFVFTIFFNYYSLNAIMEQNHVKLFKVLKIIYANCALFFFLMEFLILMALLLI